jgi:hypothetical protein
MIAGPDCGGAGTGVGVGLGRTGDAGPDLTSRGGGGSGSRRSGTTCGGGGFIGTPGAGRCGSLGCDDRLSPPGPPGQVGAGAEVNLGRGCSC